MARIICGSYGIAPDCHLYSCGYGDNAFYTDMMTCIENLLSYGVTVINCSFGDPYVEVDPDYEYTELEQWFDHVGYQHSVTICSAAGNHTQPGETWNIWTPGQAYNSITVGNINHKTDTLCTSSNYGVYEGCEKPDVCAPGEYTNNYYNNGGGGTSAATACVTGVVALTQQIKPSTKTLPHLVKALLVASCDHIAGSSTMPNGYTNEQGAGVINAYRVYTIIQKQQYFNTSVTNGSYSSNVYPVSNTYTTTYHSYAIAWLKKNTVGNPHVGSTVTNPAIADIRLVVLSSGGSFITKDNLAKNTSARVARSTAYNSSIRPYISISNVSGTVPYAMAWY